MTNNNFNSSTNHLVLGYGAMGQAIAQELKSQNLPVKIIERTKKTEAFETILVDLLNKQALMEAVNSATHIYLCAGLPYLGKIWLSDWPKIMENCIQVAQSTSAKLIFFDNAYMYGPPPLTVPFNETHPQNPKTIKGIARKQTADILLNAMHTEKIQALIGRSADFYGPKAINSPFYIQFLERILKGKNPQVLSKPNVKHTFAFTVDNAKALVKLALDPSAYGEVWHLPVGKPITFEEILEIINKLQNSHFQLKYLPSYANNLLAFFVPVIKEAKEMLYQFNEPYVMSWEKLHYKYPNLTPTSYSEGLKLMIESFK